MSPQLGDKRTLRLSPKVTECVKRTKLSPTTQSEDFQSTSEPSSIERTLGEKTDRNVNQDEDCDFFSEVQLKEDSSIMPVI